MVFLEIKSLPHLFYENYYMIVYYFKLILSDQQTELSFFEDFNETDYRVNKKIDFDGEKYILKSLF